MNKITLHQGHSIVILGLYPDNHFDSAVCDSPYELGFMGKKWDSSGISYSVAMWKEVFRVLKPGAHLLAFGGARTYHRLACAIEDAGFIIRDQIVWLYGSGFPKNLDVSKAIDKAAGAEREVVGKKSGRAGDPKQDIRGGKFVHGPVDRIDCSALTVPATALARQWDGWGTALKPAHEPIVVARKHLEGTVVKNVLKWGTGAINVAGCLIPIKPGDIGDRIDRPKSKGRESINWCNDDRSFDLPRNYQEPDGRWPANVIHDGSDEVMTEFAKTGELQSGAYPIKPGQNKNVYSFRGQVEPGIRRPTNSGSAARFFYCAKASQEERNRGLEGTTRNNHPTVKPLALMAYLVRLVTPPGGIVVDPFMGSGSTLIAAAKEGFDSVGIDLELENCEIAERRCRGQLGFLVEIIHAP